MQKGLHDHFRANGENPFLPKGLVFLAATVDGLGGAEEETMDPLQARRQGIQSAPHEARAQHAYRSAIDQFEDKFPNELVEYKSSKDVFKAEEQRTEIKGGITGIQGLIDWFNSFEQRYRGEDGKLDPKKLQGTRWEQEIAKFTSGEEFAGVIFRELKFQVSGQTLKKIRSNIAEERQAGLEEILRQNKDYVIGLERAKKEAEEEYKKYLRAQYEPRLDLIKRQWEANPPSSVAGQPDLLAKVLASIDQTKETYKDGINGESSLAEHEAAWRFLDDLEAMHRGEVSVDKYLEKFKQDHEGKEAPTAAFLRERASRIDALRKETVQSIQAEFDAQKAATLDSLNTLHAFVEAQGPETDEEGKEDEEKEEGRQKFLKEIQEQIAELGGTENLDAATAAILYSTDPLQKSVDKGETPTTVEIGGAAVPKGLMGQIDLLESNSSMTENEKLNFAAGINEALGRFEKDLKDKQVFMGNLVMTERKAKLFMASFDNKKDGGGKWQTTWVALVDFQKAFEIIQEWGARKLQRNSTKRVGNLGVNTLSWMNGLPWPLAGLNTLPSDFNRQQENSEKEEVQSYQDAYSNKDLFDVEGILYQSRNIDEFKACLFILADEGRIRWDDVRLVKQINYFQDTITFSENMAVHLSDLSSYHEKLAIAMTGMYDADTFKSFYNTNSSNYESKQQNWTQACDAASEVEGGLSTVLNGQLKNYREARNSGDNPNFDPLYYEKIIDYSIERGKLGFEEKLYYIIQGIALGIMPPDRGAAIDAKRLNAYPAIEYFTSGTQRGGRPTLEDIREVALLKKGAFDVWFWTHVMQLPKVKQRVDKALTQSSGIMDHDDCTPFTPHLGSQGIQGILKAKQDGGFFLPQTGIENTSVGMLMYIRNYAANRKDMDLDRQDLTRFIASFSTFSGILNRRMYAKQESQYFRLNRDNRNNKPRSAGAYEDSYGIPELTVEGHINKVQNYLIQLDGTFFNFLFNGDKSDGAVPKFVRELAVANGLAAGQYKDLFGGNEVNDLDQLHSLIGEYINYIFTHNPSRVTAFLAKINQDNDAHFAAVRKAKDPTIPDFFAEQAAKMSYAKLNPELHPKNEAGDELDLRLHMLLAPDQYENLESQGSGNQSSGGSTFGDDDDATPTISVTRSTF